MNQYNVSSTSKAALRSNQASQRPVAYVRWPLATYPYPWRMLGRPPSATTVDLGPLRLSSPESCLTGFKKLLSHGSRTRSYGGRSVAVLQRHKHHIGHDLVLNTARRRLSRTFAYASTARLRLVSGLAAERNGGVSRAGGRLAYVARLVEGFYEPSLTQLGWYRGLRHARQAHRHAMHGAQLSASLRAGVRRDVGKRRMYSNALGHGPRRRSVIAPADRARWSCAPGSVFVVSSSRI